jgi:ABC-type Fe3+-citrate transport system substrate-binding protein
MNKLFSIIVVAAVLLSVNACNQTNNKQNNQTENSLFIIEIF